MYLRRHDYNKPHRCSGWSGGGWRGTYDDVKPADWDEGINADGMYPWETSHGRRRHWWQARDRCNGGSIWTRYRRDPWMALRFGRCSKCDVRTIPLITQWIDPTYLWFLIRRIDFHDLRYYVGRFGLWKGTRKAIGWFFWQKGHSLAIWWKDLVFRYAPSKRAEREAEEADLRAHYGIT